MSENDSGEYWKVIFVSCRFAVSCFTSRVPSMAICLICSFEASENVTLRWSGDVEL